MAKNLKKLKELEKRHDKLIDKREDLIHKLVMTQHDMYEVLEQQEKIEKKNKK